MKDRGFSMRGYCPIIVGTLIAVASAIGCGGGGGANTPSGGTGPSAGAQTANIGMAQITFTGKPKPMSAGNSGPVSFYGEAGASYSSLTIYPTPNLAATSLVYTRQLPNGDRTYSVPALGGTPTLVDGSNISGIASCAKTGLLAYLDYSGGVFRIVTSYPDGSKYTVVLSNINAAPSISPNGSTIAYVNLSTGNIYTIPVGGGTSTEVYSGANAYSAPAVWSPDGTHIAFAAPNSGDTAIVTYTMSASGGATTNVTPASLTGTTYPTSWSPNSSNLACVNFPSTGNASIEMLSLTGGAADDLTPSTFSDTTPCFAPDNQHLAFYRSNAGGAAPGIYEEDIAGVNPLLVIPDPTTAGLSGSVGTMTWSYYPQNQKFVGSGSSLSDAAVSGLLLAQNGSLFSSLLVFGAATPSTAALTTEATGSNGSPSVFKLAANTISIISYTNVYIGAPTFLPLSGTTAALVTLDGITGQIDMVAPGEFSKKQPTSTTAGSSALVYTGKFSGIYDSKGKNLAPMGASTLQIDAKTGKLVSFQ